VEKRKIRVKEIPGMQSEKFHKLCFALNTLPEFSKAMFLMNLLKEAFSSNFSLPKQKFVK